MTEVQYEKYKKIITYLQSQYHNKQEVAEGKKNRVYKIMDDKEQFCTIRLNKIKARKQIGWCFLKGLKGLEKQGKKLNFDGKIDILLVQDESTVNHKFPKKAGKKSNNKRPFKSNGNVKRVVIKKKGGQNV